MRRLILVVAVLLAGCGEAAPGPTAAAVTTVTAGAVETTTSAPAAADPQAVLAIASGRGDDRSFEVAVWLDAAVSAADRIVIGIDADDSYPGAGDPVSHFEGWAEFSELVTVGSEGRVVAAGSSEAIADRLSWGVDGSVLRVFFIHEVAPVAGTLWVVVGTEPGAGGIAGVTTGESCSIRGSGLPFAVGGDVPDPGTVCDYR